MVASQPQGSVVLASCFSPEDYLIVSAALSPGSEQAEQLCAGGQANSEGAKAILLVPPRWPSASHADPAADRLSPTSAGSSAERRPPTRQRLLPAAVAAGALSGSHGGSSSSSSSSSISCHQDGAERDEECSEFPADGGSPWASVSGRHGGSFGRGGESGTDGGDSCSDGMLAGAPLACTTPLRVLSHSPEPCGGCPLADGSDAEAGGLITPAGYLLAGGGGTGGSSCAAGSCGIAPSTSSTPAVLQQRLELAEARVLAGVEARRASQRRLAEQDAEAERQYQALGQQYEERLAALRQELQAAAAAGSLGAEGLSHSILAGSQKVTLSAQEQDALRRQLADQEVLLRAYQAENELAVERLKQQQAEAARRAEEGAVQLEEMQQALAQAQAERGRQPPAVDAARLQELLRLQAELQGVQAAAAQREGQLQQQIQRLEQQLQEAHRRAEALQAECTQLHDTQQQLTDSDRLVRQQAEVIRQLEQQLHLQEAASSSTTNAASSHQLLLLQAENASLRQTLEQQQQQAQPHLLASPTNSPGAPDSDGSGAEELRRKLSKLQDALRLKDEQQQRQVRALRREHERLRVEQGIRAASRAGVGRVKELEAQLEAQRKRVRMLESKLLLASRERGAAALPPASDGSSAARGSSAPPAGDSVALKAATPTPRVSVGKAAAAQREALMAATMQLQQKEQRVRRLEAELAALQKRTARADEQLNAAAEQQLASGQELAALKQAVAEVTAANDALQAQAREVPLLQQQLAEQQAAAAELRQQAALLHDAKAAVASLQAQQAGAQRQAAAREEQHAAEIRGMEQEHAMLLEQARQAGSQAAAGEWQPRVQAAEQRAAELRGRAEQLEHDLCSARAGLPWTPSAADFAELERRMAECEARAQAREAHWRGVAEAQQRAVQAQQERLRQRLEGGQQAMGGFQCQLDRLLAAARLLPGQAGPGTTVPSEAP